MMLVSLDHLLITDDDCRNLHRPLESEFAKYLPDNKTNDDPEFERFEM
jgi:hypothetical protein